MSKVVASALVAAGVTIQVFQLAPKWREILLSPPPMAFVALVLVWIASLFVLAYAGDKEKGWPKRVVGASLVGTAYTLIYLALTGSLW